jgi:hypothetical protein
LFPWVNFSAPFDVYFSQRSTMKLRTTKEQGMEPPYTTPTGLKIGSAYQKRQRPEMDSDASRLQEALLSQDTGRREILTEDRMTAIMIAMIVIVVVLVALEWL